MLSVIMLNVKILIVVMVSVLHPIMCFPGFSSNYYSSQKKLAKGQTL
jgi:hypothetical protein